jgi:DNA-binding NtrC family response regulator
MSNSRVLVVEDDDELRFLLERALKLRGHDVLSAPGAEQALTALETREFDAMVTDLRMPEMDGLALCARARERHPNLKVVLMTAFGSTGNAVEAMRLGVSDFIQKPVDVAQLERALARSSVREERDLRRLDLQEPEAPFERLIGTSAATQHMVRQVRRVADSDCTVLVTGESGTGKELIARTLHEHGKRRAGPFVAINCAAVTRELLESEFFGHSRGAFTGAALTNEGLLMAANGGTIFFDEVSAMPLELQAKLLRALQERSVRAVGSKNEAALDVRIIAAANENLDLAVEQRAFRQDLLFRLDVVRIHLPPLRERGTDVLELANHFLRSYAAKAGKTVRGFTEDATERLLTYDWPGNVRELENCVHAALALVQKEWITAEDLPAKLRKARAAPRVTDSATPEFARFEEVERQYIDRVLRAVQGNKAAAARILGINRVTLYRKLAQSTDAD